MSLYSELKRRNVFRIAAAYCAGAWLAIQLVNEISPLLGLPESLGRVVLLALAIGFAPALVLAWIYDWTPQGIATTKQRDASAVPVTPTHRKFDLTVIGMLTVALFVLVLDNYVFNETPASSLRPTIAVLPFEDLSPSGDQEWFSDGISGELAKLLAKIPELTVTGMTSARAFKGTAATIPEIATALNVDHVVEGSVRQFGNSVRIQAQLVEARIGSQLWSDSYDRTMDDVFAIQEDIATAIVDALRVQLLGPLPKLDETSPIVLERYLQAREINDIGRTNRARLPEAELLLLGAIDEDVNYFPAWGALVETYNNMGAAGIKPREEAVDLARQTLNRMDARFPNRPEVAAYRGWQAFNYDHDFATAARYFEQARSLDARFVPPAAFLMELKRPLDAIEIAQYELQTNPMYYSAYETLLRAFAATEKYQDFDATYEQANARELLDDSHTALYGDTLLRRGEPERARAVFDELAGVPLLRLRGLAMAYHDLGRDAEFNATFAELEKFGSDVGADAAIRNRASIAKNMTAGVYAYVRDLDSAFAILNQQEELPITAFDGPIGIMKQHPQWDQLAAKAGLLPSDPRDNIDFEFSLPQ